MFSTTSSSDVRVALFYSDKAELLLSNVEWSDGRPTAGYVVNGGWSWNASRPELADFIFWLAVPDALDYNAALAWADKQYAESGGE